MSNSTDTREKIIKAAEKIFAEKSFDGARVDEIAREADVNKALIYYYFDSKEDILNSLFSTLLNEFTELYIDELEKIIPYDEDKVDNIIELIIDYIISKKNILKIAVIESLKGGPENSIIMQVGDLMLSTEIEQIARRFEEKGMKFPQDKEELVVGEFFTGFMPIINYVIFHDDLSAYFKIDPDKMRKDFIKAFKQSHFAYHRTR